MDDEGWFEDVRRDAGRCPFCGSDSALPIMYGMPLADDYERLQGDVVFAGCLVSADPPRFSCGECRFSWGRSVAGEPPP